MRLLFFIFSMLYSLTTWSQIKEVQFEIIDRSSRLPLQEVFVRINGEPWPILSNQQGQIKVEVSSNQNTDLIFSLIGYKSFPFVYKPSENLSLVKIFLEEESLFLQTIVVSASRSEQRQEEVSVSMNVLKPYLIENRNTTDMQVLLNQSPGVNITDGQANIRSGSGWSYGAGSRVQVLLDGLPLISPDANQVQWSLLPQEAAGQVEVLKGASSALFGSSALNGSIQLRTLEPKEKPFTRVAVFQTSYLDPPRPDWKWWNAYQGSTGIRFLHTRKLEKWDLILSGFGQQSAGYKWNERDDRARINLKTRFHVNEELSIGLAGGVLYSQNGETLLWDNYARPYIGLDSSITKNSGLDFYFDPSIRYRKGKGIHEWVNRFLRVENNSANETTVFDNSSEQLQSQYSYQYFSEKWGVITGGVFLQMAQSNSEIFEGYHNASNLAGFAQWDGSWNRWKSSIGFRLEEARVDEVRYAQPVARFGLNYRAFEATYLRTSFGQGFRFPSMAELFTRTNIGAINVFPNRELEPEKGYSIELGIRQLLAQSGLWKGYIDIATYYMRYDNMMEFSFGIWEQPVGVGFKSVNVGPTSVSGIELEFGAEGKWRQIDFRWMAGANFANPISLDPEAVYAQDANGNNLTYESTSSDTSNAVLKYRYKVLLRSDLELGWKKWTFGTSIRYNDFMQNIDAVFDGPIIDFILPDNGFGRYRDELNRGDFMVDLRIQFALRKQWTLSLQSENLNNRAVMSRPGKMEAPRTLTFGIRYEG
jgi:outer membrane receptor for ferrienterochelin and colicins